MHACTQILIAGSMQIKSNLIKRVLNATIWPFGFFMYTGSVFQRSNILCVVTRTFSVKYNGASGNLRVRQMITGVPESLISRIRLNFKFKLRIILDLMEGNHKKRICPGICDVWNRLTNHKPNCADLRSDRWQTIYHCCQPLIAKWHWNCSILFES